MGGRHWIGHGSEPGERVAIVAGGAGGVRDAGPRVECRDHWPWRRLGDGADRGYWADDDWVRHAAGVAEVRDAEPTTADIDVVRVAGERVVTARPEHFTCPEVLAVGAHGVTLQALLPARVKVDPVVPVHRTRQVDAALDLIRRLEQVGSGRTGGADVGMEAAGEIEPALHVQDRDIRGVDGLA